MQKEAKKKHEKHTKNKYGKAGGVQKTEYKWQLETPSGACISRYLVSVEQARSALGKL